METLFSEKMVTLEKDENGYSVKNDLDNTNHGYFLNQHDEAMSSYEYNVQTNHIIIEKVKAFLGI